MKQTKSAQPIHKNENQHNRETYQTMPRMIEGDKT
jgi:hypothetical protein